MQRSDQAVESARSALEQLIESLRAEGEAIIGGDVDRLNGVIQEKDKILQRLGDAIGLLSRADMRRTVREVRELNERNGRLLAAHIAVNQARIRTLFGSSYAGMLYASDGHSAGMVQRPTARGVRA